MNEMKPEDVMKALECCIIQCVECRKCPMFYRKDNRGICYTELKRLALALLRKKDARINELELKIAGIMWFVDKWLDGKELIADEVKRAEIMREKTLRIIEEKDADIERRDAKINTLQKQVRQYGAEIDRLKGESK